MGMLFVGNVLRAAEVNQSTPKDTVISFAKALDAGDAASIKQLVTGTDKQVAMMEGAGNMMSAMKRMQDAAVAKWGDAGKAIAGEMGKPSDEILKNIDKAEIKEEGDTATFKGQNDKETVKLKKVDGKWKIDLASMPDQGELEKAGPALKAMTKAADDTATDIKADKFKTVDEAKQAFGMKVMAAVMSAAATSQPAEK